MAWTTPRTWVADELVTATIMNTHVRDNLTYLLTSRSNNVAASTAQASTSSTSYVAVDGTNLIVSVTPASSRVLVMATMRVQVDNTASNNAMLQLYGDNGAGSSAQTARVYQNAYSDVTLFHIYTGLSAGTTYSFYPIYKAATGTIYVNPQFSVVQYNAAVLALEV